MLSKAQEVQKLGESAECHKLLTRSMLLNFINIAVLAGSMEKNLHPSWWRHSGRTLLVQLSQTELQLHLFQWHNLGWQEGKKKSFLFCWHELSPQGGPASRVRLKAVPLWAERRHTTGLGSERAQAMEAIAVWHSHPAIAICFRGSCFSSSQPDISFGWWYSSREWSRDVGEAEMHLKVCRTWCWSWFITEQGDDCST